MKKVMRGKPEEILSKQNLLIELKCFLQHPMESNLDILVNEMKELIKGPKEVEYHDSAPDIEKALSLEDLFK